MAYDHAARPSTTGIAGSVFIFVADAAPNASPATGRYGSGRVRARHTAHTDTSTKPTAGTSSVASEPWAIRSGENAYSASAASPPTEPVRSRAKANTTRPNSSVSTITGSRAQNITRHASFPDSYRSRRPRAPWSPSKPGVRRGRANTSPPATISLPRGGCSGLKRRLCSRT